MATEVQLTKPELVNDRLQGMISSYIDQPAFREALKHLPGYQDGDYFELVEVAEGGSSVVVILALVPEGGEFARGYYVGKMLKFENNTVQMINSLRREASVLIDIHTDPDPGVQIIFPRLHYFSDKDTAESAGFYFLLQDYNGETLQGKLVSQKLKYYRQLAGVYDHLIGRGIYYLDSKDDNCTIVDEDTVGVIDCNLASRIPFNPEEINDSNNKFYGITNLAPVMDHMELNDLHLNSDELFYKLKGDPHNSGPFLMVRIFAAHMFYGVFGSSPYLHLYTDPGVSNSEKAHNFHTMNIVNQYEDSFTLRLIDETTLAKLVAKFLQIHGIQFPKQLEQFRREYSQILDELSQWMRLAYAHESEYAYTPEPFEGFNTQMDVMARTFTQIVEKLLSKPTK